MDAGSEDSGPEESEPYSGPAWPLDGVGSSFSAAKQLPDQLRSQCVEHGVVDPALWTLTGLTSLDLCGLELQLANGPELAALHQLRDLQLSHNLLGEHWTGGVSLLGLTQLRSLSLDHNGLSALPTAIVALANLQILNASANQLSVLPHTLGMLPELHTLLLSSNPLPSLPEALFDAPQLRVLELRGCQLEGELQGGFSRLPLLSELDLNSNRLSSFPAQLADCPRLKSLDIGGNPLKDKKLLKLADGVQAKPLLKHLRGGSKSQAKIARAAVPQEVPPRQFSRPCEKDASTLEGASGEEDSCGGGKKKKKKGKSKPAAAIAARQVLISREALSVRAHMCVCVLHVVGGGGAFFAPEADLAEPEAFDRFEACLALLQDNNLPDLQPGEQDEAYTAAQSAKRRFDRFISLQTEIHHDPALGDKRRLGAMGSHNAQEFEADWPLVFSAREHSKVCFKPLSIGWMESKGVMDAVDFCSHCIRGDPHLRKHALSLMACPLCPVFETSAGLVLSVPPLSNGYESRTTADCTGGVLLECSSDLSEASCRAMLMRLIEQVIELIESEDSVATVLVEPVEVVCAWNPARVLSHFPCYAELEGLPPL